MFSFGLFLYTPTKNICQRGNTQARGGILTPMKASPKIIWHIGIDEVGRGPIAGPVTIGIFGVKHARMKDTNVTNLLRTVKDSKQLTAVQREHIFREIQILTRTSKDIFYRTVSIPAHEIDEKGIAACIRKAITRGLAKVAEDSDDVSIRLDGGLRAPDRFIHQETIIRGDQKEPLISTASIVAKVVRDRYMVRMDAVFPNYGFAQHKGYGTKQHYRALEKKGVCELHRKTWIKT